MKLLGEGEAVAIQGDRILFEVSPITVEFDRNWVWSLPKGPLALAAASGVPIYPVFVVRTGYKQYRVEMGAKIELERTRGAGREQALKNAAIQWGNVLGNLIHRHGDQWFVFEPMFTKND